LQFLRQKHFLSTSLSLRRSSSSKRHTKRLPIALPVAAATLFAAARVIEVLHSPEEALVSRIGESDSSTRLPARELDPLRPTIAFWDDDYASDKDWDKYTHKGGALMCGLEGSDETAGGQMGDKRTPPSARTQFNGDLKTELQNWYWHDINPSSFSCRLAEHWHLLNAMQSLRLDGRPASEGGDNTCYRVEHRDSDNTAATINQWYKVPGIEREFHVRTPGDTLFYIY
jgi:hypothetical protein